MNEIKDTFLRLVGALAEARVPYAVTGGFAVAAWGEIRTTADIDLLLDVDEASAHMLSASLARAGLGMSVDDVRDVLREGGHVTIFDQRSIYHADALLAQNAPVRLEIRDAREAVVFGARCRVVAPEDLLVHKLRFGSAQDVRDAEGIYARQRERLDRPALAAKAARLGVEPQLRDLEARVDRAIDRK